MSIEWTALILYVGLLLFIGFYVGRKIKTSKEYFTMGRNLRWYIIIFTVTAAGFSGWAFVGAPGLAYNYGTVGLLDSGLAWAFPCAMVGAVLIKHFRDLAVEYDSISVAGIISSAHGNSKKLLSLVSGVLFIQYMFFITAQLKASGMILSTLLNISTTSGAVLGITVILVYVFVSGLEGVEITDVVGSMFMIATVTLVVVGIYHYFGGFGGAISELEAIDPGLVGPFESGKPFAATPILAFLSYGIAATAFMWQPSLGQKYISVEKLDEVKLGWIGLALALFFIGLCILAFGGVGARILHPGLENPDLAMPTFLKAYLPASIFTVVSLGIFSAILTSADSYLLSISASVENALEPLKGGEESWASRHSLALGRVLSVVAGVICLFWVIIEPPQFLSFLAIVGAVGLASIITGPLLIMFYWDKGGTEYGAIISILVTYIIYMTMSWYGFFGWTQTAVIGMTISAVSYVGVSELERKIQ